MRSTAKNSLLAAAAIALAGYGSFPAAWSAPTFHNIQPKRPKKSSGTHKQNRRKALSKGPTP